MVSAARAELIISEVRNARQQAKILRLDQRLRDALPCADPAIAAATAVARLAGVQFDVRLESHCAAMATAIVGLFHGSISATADGKGFYVMLKLILGGGSCQRGVRREADHAVFTS
jgi:hypothetical protein